MTLTPNEVAEAARKKVAELSPEIENSMKSIWSSISDEIRAGESTLLFKGGYVTSSRLRASRLEFLTAFIEGAGISECTARARKAGGLS